ncbi:recombination endonuclease VII [Vibrio phage vB_VpaP_SJSY21]|nr:recombination endonuclease VII [Vibrio phage vB_VpaP_SJSY21]
MKPSEIKPLRDLMLEEQGGKCKICGQPAKTQRPTLDHCHDTGHVRGVLCNACNRMEGRIKSRFVRYGLKNRDVDFGSFLRGLADYVSEDYSKNPLHPMHLNTLTKEFRSFKKDKQVEELNRIGITFPEKSTKKFLEALYAKHISETQR